MAYIFRAIFSLPHPKGKKMNSNIVLGVKNKESQYHAPKGKTLVRKKSLSSKDSTFTTPALHNRKPQQKDPGRSFL